MPNLALIDLVLPYVLRGENLGANHVLLSTLRVTSFETANDPAGVVLRGRAEVNGQVSLNLATGTFTASTSEAAPAYDPARADPIFDLAETSIDFELVVQRAPSQIVADGIAGGVPSPVSDVVTALGGTDAPSTGFVLDLVLNAPSLRPPFLHPAKVNSLGVLEPDTDHREVAIGFPRLRFRLTHGNPDPSRLVLALTGSGVSSLDDPGSLDTSELITMDPPYAYVSSGNSKKWGFGFRSALLDLDRGYTPPGLAAKTGIGDDWQGIYLPEARLFVSPNETEDLAFECGAKELLIGLDRTTGIWGDFEAALVDQGDDNLTINARFDGNSRSYPVTLTGFEGGVWKAIAHVPEHATLIVDVEGGRPPYARKVKIDGGAETTTPNVQLDLSSAQHTATVDIEVTSSRPSPQPAKMHIDVDRLVDQPRLTVPGEPVETTSDAVIDSQSGDLTFTIDGGGNKNVTISTRPTSPDRVWTEGATNRGTSSAITVSIEDGASRTFSVDRPAVTGPKDLDCFFHFDSPNTSSGSAVMSSTWAVDESRTGAFAAGTQLPVTAFGDDFRHVVDNSTVTITGNASYEGDPGDSHHNALLGRGRALAARGAFVAAIGGEAAVTTRGLTINLVPPPPPTPPQGDITQVPAWDAAWVAAVGWGPGHGGDVDARRKFWWANVHITAATPARHAEVTVRRPTPTSTPTSKQVRPPDPQLPEASPPPSWFRSAKVKVRVVDSKLIALQLDMEVDFQTLAEDRLQGHMGAAPALPPARTLQHGQPLGPDNPADGITLFRLLLQTDPATGRVDLLLSAGADPADKDGLMHWGWIPNLDQIPSKDLALTIMGSYLSFWPMLAALPSITAAAEKASTALDGPDKGVVDAVITGTALGTPLVIAALPWFTIERVIFYGIEYLQSTREDDYTGTLLIDVQMDWSMDILGIVVIEREKPLKVRYKAIGVQFSTTTGTDAGGGPTPTRLGLHPVFDASRGFTIDVTGGTGGLKITGPLGKILQIAGARLSKTNPLTLDVDIVLAVDLGVVKVDRASVRAYLDGSAPPELTALSATIDIPGAIVGAGYMRIGSAPDGTKTIGGQLDLTIRPVSVRVAAAVEIATITSGARTATGVYVGLDVVLPVGIPLGSTGLGIFGFRGIFGMHYERAPLTHPDTSVPTLAWLKNADGKPHLLKAPNGTVLWQPAIDHWAFGLGILIGTMEGGVILNLDGTLLVELPGPRLLIMMNARIVSPPPSVSELGMKGGILAVIEITPEHFLIGILVNWDIEDLVKITIPVEAVFPFGSASDDWHVYLGARKDYGASVEVEVLKIVKGTGYLMFRGRGIQQFPLAHSANPLPEIKGFGIALGMGASLVFGDKSSGLYLQVGGGLDAVLGFDPFTLAGNLWVAGELRLWIVSIGADASLTVLVADTGGGHLDVSVKGQACGHVSFLFFEVKGCVKIEISMPEPDAAIPSLVEKVLLQSRSPALAHGTAVDRGVDTSLGNAPEVGSYPGDANVPIVPIDAIPVISFLVPPDVATGVTIGGLGFALTPAPGLQPGGVAERSGDRYHYLVSKIRLERVKGNGQVDAATLSGGETPATWWTINPATTPSPSAQLALLTWQVDPATKALEYTERRVEDVNRRWGQVCERAAPATEVLWTFKLEPLGPSDTGWSLEGIAWPDPPSTHRSVPPETTLLVSEPWRTGDPLLDGLRGVAPAYVTGTAVACQRLRRWPRPLAEAILATEAAERLVVRGGIGPLGHGIANRSGLRLAETDPVLDLIAPPAGGAAVRISEAFHDKATAAIPGLRDLVRRAGTRTTLAVLLDSAGAGTPLLRETLDHALALGDKAATIDSFRPGARCPVKVLVAPEFDYGLASNFGDEASRRALKIAGIGDEKREIANIVRLHTGPYADLGVLLLTTLRENTRYPIVANVIDAVGNLLDRIQLRDSHFLAQGAVLPARWTDLTGPWGYDVTDLLTYAAMSKLEVAYLPVPGHQEADHVDLGRLFEQDSFINGITQHELPNMPGYQVGGISMVTGAESDRTEWDDTQRSNDKDQLIKATSPAATDHAVLKPDSRYRVVVEWTADRLARPDGSGAKSQANTTTQTFWFRTDRIETDPTDAERRLFNDQLGTPPEGKPTPVRLDPWVMVSLPDDNETGVFGHEPLRLVFNTPDVDRLFAEYGKELRLRLFAANGQHPADPPMPLVNGVTMTPVPGVVLPPWHEALAQAQAAGQPSGDPSMPCVDIDATSNQHTVLDIPIPLQPNLGYLLDVEMVDQGAADEARGPRVFRRHLTTGGFGTLQALADSVGAVLPSAQHAPAGTFSGLLALGTRPEGAVVDAHLIAHELTPWHPPITPRVVVFWEPGADPADPPQPAAMLIEATEALTRFRDVPKRVDDTTVNPPTSRWILEAREWLTVQTSGTAPVAGISYPAGGQRAVIVLSPGARGQSLQVDLTASGMSDLPFLGLTDRTATLSRITFTRAPWEEES